MGRGTDTGTDRERVDRIERRRRDLIVTHDIGRIVAFALAAPLVHRLGLRPHLWWLVLVITAIGITIPLLRLLKVITRDAERAMIIDLYYGAILAAVGGRIGAVVAAVVGTMVISATVLPRISVKLAVNAAGALAVGALVDWMVPPDSRRAGLENTNAIAAWAVMAMLAFAATLALRGQRSETTRMSRERDLARAQLTAAIDVSNVSLMTIDRFGRIRAVAGWSQFPLQEGDFHRAALSHLPDATTMLDDALAGQESSASLIVGDTVLHAVAKPAFRRQTLDGALLAISDITHPVASSRRSEQASRWKSDFIATVSHELRTPLTAVLGFARTLETTEDIEEGHEYLKILIDQAQEAANIVEDLLVATRQDVGDLTFLTEEVDLLEDVTLVIRGLGEKANGVGVTGDHTFARGDRVRIRQIIRNLITNAIKYGGSSIRVEVLPRDDHAVVTVADDGSGVPLIARDLVFRPFYQVGTRDVPDGIGLGLYVARSLANAMDGDLTYSYIAGWSRFSLSLPEAAPTESSIRATG